MLFAVGTENPVKIAAVKAAVKKIWPDSVVKGVFAESGVRMQPKGNEEAIKGAENRALKAIQKTNADFGIGLEGTVAEINGKMFLSGWVAVISKNGKKGLSSTASVLLPEKISREIKNGKELGPVMDLIACQNDVKKKQGAVGILTKGRVTRKEAFEQAVLLALAPFICPEHYLV